jgi:hypothetical protein
MLPTEPKHISELLHSNEDDMIYEVRLIVPGRKGSYVMDHWFDGTREEAELRELKLMQMYVHMHDKVRIKVQPHILKRHGRRFQMDHESDREL